MTLDDYRSECQGMFTGSEEYANGICPAQRGSRDCCCRPAGHDGHHADVKVMGNVVVWPQAE